MNIVRLSPGYFPNSSVGRALSSADIYVGIPDLDPEVVANQKTLSAQQEDGTIVAVTQPVSTGAGGVPLYEGSPVTLLVEGDYSLKVLDSNGSQIYYVPSTAYEQYLVSGNYYYPDYSEADQGVVSVGSGSTVTDILAEVGVVTKATLYFSHNSGEATTTYIFTTSTVILSNFNIIVERGVILDGTGTLTINGKFEKGIEHCFGTSITVVFGHGSCKELISEWWGENTVPGTTDLTTYLQYWLDSMYDSNMPGFLPKGRHYTGKLDYAGQSIRGVPGSGGYEAITYSSEMSSFLGKDSEDIFNYSVDSPANSNIFKRGTILKDLLFIVDDTTDASSSYTNRNGGGNACIALDHIDGDTNDPNSTDNFTFIRARLQNIAFVSKSMDANGKNNSIAFFQQGLIYDVTFEQVAFARCQYGFWGWYPETNTAEIEYAPDSLKFRNCLIECMNPFVIYNSLGSTINNMQVYGSAADDKGISLKRVTSNIRGDTYFWTITDLYQEIGNTSGTGEIGEIEGRNHVFINGILINAYTEQYYTWDADHCTVIGTRINSKTGNPSFVISGSNNEFTNIVTSYSDRDWFTDTGIGNRIDIMDSAQAGLDVKSTRKVTQNFSRNSYPALAQMSHFPQRLPSTPYYGNEDLFFWPSDITWEQPVTEPTITKDTTVGGSGEYATMITPGGQYYFSEIGRVFLKAGYQVPLGRIRVYAMVKMSTSATTQNWNIDVNGAGTEIDDRDCIVTTSWSVIHFDADLTGLTKGHSVYIRMGAPTANQAWYLAWIAIVPYEEHDLGAHIGRGWGVYDFDVNGGTVGDHILGTLFDNTVITRAWYEGITDPTSGGAATIAIGVESDDANGIITATAFDNAIFDPGWHDGTPDGTSTNFTTQTTEVRHVVFTIAGATLTAGKFKVFWEYAVGE